MFIDSIYIKNFRSIKELEIFPSNLCALIGPNSVGKTNILKALDLVIGEGWTTKAKVARELFCDSSKSINITVNFKKPIEFTNRRGYEESILRINLTMSLEPELSSSTTINDNATFYSQEEFKRRCHFILIPSERQLGKELRVSQWTMLGKIMRVVFENYISHYEGDEKLLKEDFAKKILPAKNFLEADFADDVTFKKFVDTFNKYCSQNSAGLADEFEPVLDIYNLNWFYKTLQIHVKEGIVDKFLDSEEVGSGMQNLLMISIFQTYAELMGGKVIFGIEEPEIYLYPHAQRSLYSNFVELSKQTQIFYSTHNPNLVDASRPDDIVLLRKNSEKGTYILEKDDYFNSENSENSWHKIYTNFNPERNELFFASKVLLVEGSSDKILFSTLCEDRWDINLDESGISIIECGGKGGIVYFIGVCKLIGLDEYFAVWDKDNDINNNNLLDEAKRNNKGIELDPNLEVLLSLPSGNEANKVKNAYEWANDINNEIPGMFDLIKQFLQDTYKSQISNPLDEDIDFSDIPF